MILAHAPSGYLLYQALPKSWKNRKTQIATIIGAVAPDFDLFFNILGFSQLNHRFFISHTPYFWCTLYLLVIIIRRLQRTMQPWIHAFFIGALLHLTLDLPSGIRIFYPLSSYMVNWFPMIYSFDLTTFQHFTHPYILADLGICLVAGFVFLKNRRLSSSLSYSESQLEIIPK